MMFTDVAGGETVFVDANIFIYAFAPEPTLAELKLTHLASHDADFDRMSGIVR